MQWLKVFEDGHRFLTCEGQELIDGSDYHTLKQRLDDVYIYPEVCESHNFQEQLKRHVQVCDQLTRDMWNARGWSLRVQFGFYTKVDKGEDGVAGLETLSVDVQHSEPAGILWGKDERCRMGPVDGLQKSECKSHWSDPWTRRLSSDVTFVLMYKD